MIKLTKSSTIYNHYSTNLLDFMVSNGFLIDSKITIPISDFKRIQNNLFEFTLQNFADTVIINDVKWYQHIDENFLHYNNVVDNFGRNLRKLKDFIGGYHTQEIPTIIYDLDNSGIGGELIDRISKICSQ